jgi:hypothetical protein
MVLARNANEFMSCFLEFFILIFIITFFYIAIRI